jgi:hypothetical protein
VINYIKWRDQQIGSFSGHDNKQTLLAQEKVMLDFICQFPHVRWCWAGDNNNFKLICADLVQIATKTDECDGIILYGNLLHGLMVKDFVAKVKKLIFGKQYVYLGVNRYEIIGHDFARYLPESIEDSIDFIVKNINPDFRRLARFPQVDGNHMVFAHPMDCFGICK